ncbi:MAG: peptidase S8 [Bacteroidetes bacterium]|nr:MAG: peptidase S8 [Bacteroidota bacterium]
MIDTMKKLLLLSFCACFSLPMIAQQRYWVFFTDKGSDASLQLAHPEAFLSAEALAIREKQQISPSIGDLPVYQGYMTQLRALGIETYGSSRWLNAAVIDESDILGLQGMGLSFVKGIRPLRRMGVAAAAFVTPQDVQESLGDPLTYGNAFIQNEMLHIRPLHERGFTGKGVRVAVFDAGFSGVDTIGAFDSLRLNKRILHTYDFVDKDTYVYEKSSHGTHVLSTFAAYKPGAMVGTAPEVSVILCRTEDASSETQIEEYNWLRAMEWVDSIGVDIIHSSLGYTQFDDGVGSYTYEQIDGNTPIITRAADLAASRGIIVTVSAGNEGTDDWHYIAAPCDADSVLCVGSVNKTGMKSSFSSFGPASDGQVKPDVTAMGERTTVASPNGKITTGNGTSYSAPLMAGFVACLRQAHPKRSNMDIIQAVRLSADQYLFPDEEYGYGIPDAVKADSLLSHVQDLSTVTISMTAKPERGTLSFAVPQKPVLEIKDVAPVYTRSPKSQVSLSNGRLEVKVPEGNTLNQVTLYKDKLRVSVPASAISNQGGTYSVKVSKFIPGEYYLEVVSDSFEERIPFVIP